MPEYEKRSDVELLEGSGVVEDDRMVANIRCGDCKSLDLNGRTSWVLAWLSGDPVDSTDPAAAITFHEQKTILDVDLSQARIRSDQNPFLDLRPGDIGGTRGDNAVFATDVDGRGTRRDGFLIAHGVIMTVVFIALYPLGALLMPVFNQWFLHSISQLIAYILMWTGLALGTIHARHGNYVSIPHSFTTEVKRIEAYIFAVWKADAHTPRPSSSNPPRLPATLRLAPAPPLHQEPGTRARRPYPHLVRSLSYDPRHRQRWPGSAACEKHHGPLGDCVCCRGGCPGVGVYWIYHPQHAEEGEEEEAKAQGFGVFCSGWSGWADERDG